MTAKTSWPPPKPRHDKSRTALDAAIEAGAQGYAGLKARLAEAAKVQPGQIAQAQLGRRALTIEQYRAVAAYFIESKGIPWVTLPWLLRDRSRISGGLTIEHGEDSPNCPDAVTVIATHLAAIPAGQRTRKAALAAVHAALYAHDEGWHSWAPESPPIVATSVAEYAKAAGAADYDNAAKATEVFVSAIITAYQPPTWAELRRLFEEAITLFEHPRAIKDQDQETDP